MKPYSILCLLIAVAALLGAGCKKTDPTTPGPNTPATQPDSGSATPTNLEPAIQSKNNTAVAVEAEPARTRVRAMERALQAAAAAIQKMESQSKQLDPLDYFQPGQPKLMALIRTVKQEIGAVDTTSCPQEFRDAYLDFTHRLNDGWNAMDPYLGWRGQKLGLLKPWKILEIDEKTDEAMRPMNAAWQRLERIAVAGGATLPK